MTSTKSLKEFRKDTSFVTENISGFMKTLNKETLQRAALEILYGAREKLHVLDSKCMINLVSQYDSCLGLPLFLGFMELTEAFRFILLRECIVYNGVLFGLVKKELVVSGSIDGDPGSCIYAVVLLEIGDVIGV